MILHQGDDNKRWPFRRRAQCGLLYLRSSVALVCKSLFGSCKKGIYPFLQSGSVPTFLAYSSEVVGTLVDRDKIAASDIFWKSFEGIGPRRSLCDLLEYLVCGGSECGLRRTKQEHY